MTKFLFIYHGGTIPQSKADQERTMNLWGQWFGSMGDAVVDGGNPVGKSATVMSDKSIVNHGGSNPSSGYSIVRASDLESALAMAKGCPILERDGSIEVAPLIDM
jgi:hypothetical protein